MLNMRKYVPLGFALSFGVRGALYPMSMIKTRMQIQRQDSVYKGMGDALKQVYRTEGYRGLYKVRGGLVI